MGIKRSVKRSAVRAGRLLSRSNVSGRRVVLCYHSVHPKQPFASTKPEIFDLQIQWLKENCNLTSLRELAAIVPSSPALKPAVAITFDDGYEDNHSQALPILMKHGVPAAFFLTAGFVDRDPGVMARFQQLWRCGPDDVIPLCWSQIRELHNAGMEIGSHTYSHANLARLTSSEANREMHISKDLIGEQLGAAIDLFAYPFGKPRIHFTATTLEIVRNTGYRMAVAVTSRGMRMSDSLFSIPRFFADGDDIRKLEDKTRGVYDLIGWWQEHMPLRVLSAVSPDDFGD